MVSGGSSDVVCEIVDVTDVDGSAAINCDLDDSEFPCWSALLSQVTVSSTIVTFRRLMLYFSFSHSCHNSQ